MGRSQRVKGNRGEREACRELAKHLGGRWERSGFCPAPGRREQARRRRIGRVGLALRRGQASGATLAAGRAQAGRGTRLACACRWSCYVAIVTRWAGSS